MSVADCAEIVARGDDERFRSAMAAPVAARRVLFPLHAFALEVARAPWMTQEPLVAEMRLQWWRDALEEIAGGGTVRAHPVAEALAEAVPRAGAARLDAAVEARRWDIYRDAFADEAAFHGYLDATGGALVWTAAEALGAPPEAEADLRAAGAAVGLARFLRAVPALEAQGRVPLVDGRPAAVAGLAEQGLAGLRRGRAWRRRLGPVAGAALLEGWFAEPVLRRVRRDPGRVARGALALSPLEDRVRLMLMAATRMGRA